VYDFLTTGPNAIVEPIHSKAKAMPVILTTEEVPANSRHRECAQATRHRRARRPP
jgi:putative SOS response-associated peptidase YedK